MAVDKEGLKAFIDGLDDEDKEAMRDELQIVPVVDADALDALNDFGKRITSIEELLSKKPKPKPKTPEPEPKKTSMLDSLAGFFK